MAVQYTPLQTKGIRAGGGVGGMQSPNIMQSFLQGAQIADSFMTLYRNAKDRKVVDGYAQTGWENITTDQQVDWARRSPESAQVAHNMWMGKKQIENMQSIRAREAAQDKLLQSQSARQKLDAMLMATMRQSNDPFERVRIMDSVLDNLNPKDPEEAAILEQAQVFEMSILDMTTGKRALTDGTALMMHHWYGNYTQVNTRYVEELKQQTQRIKDELAQQLEHEYRMEQLKPEYIRLMEQMPDEMLMKDAATLLHIQKFGLNDQQAYAQQQPGESDAFTAKINNIEIGYAQLFGDATKGEVWNDPNWRENLGKTGGTFDELYGKEPGKQQTTDTEQPGKVTRNPTVVGDENIQVLKEGSGGYLQTRGAGMRSQVSLPTDDTVENTPSNPLSEISQISQNPTGTEERVKMAVMSQSLNKPDQPEAMTEWKLKNFKSGNLTISPNDQDPSQYDVRDSNNVVIDTVKVPDKILQQINAEAGGLAGMIGQPPAQGQQPQQPQQQFDAQGVPAAPAGPPQGMSPTQAPPPQGMPTPAPPGGQPPVDLDRFNEIMELYRQSQQAPPAPGQMQGSGQTPMDAGQAPAASPSAAPPQQVPPAPPSPSGPIEGTGQTPLDSGQQPAAPDIPDLEGAFKAQNAPTQYEVALDDYLGESLGTEKPEERDYFYETLKKHEGFVKTPRQTMQGKDSEGKDYPTVVGYGNALPLSKELAEAAGISEELRQKLNRGEGSVTREQASALMKAGIKENWDKSVALVKDKREFDMTTLSTNQKMALMNMAFLLGPSRLNGFKLMIGALKIGDWKEAAKQIEESDMVRKGQINKSRLQWLQKNIQIT